MKTKFSIGLFILSFVLIYLFSSSISNSLRTESESMEKEESVSADGHVLKKEGYYLYEANGFVVVYLSDQKTPYEYTDILFEDLPELLRQEIKNGKYIKDAEELYGFLENYSS